MSRVVVDGPAECAGEAFAPAFAFDIGPTFRVRFDEKDRPAERSEVDFREPESIREPIVKIQLSQLRGMPDSGSPDCATAQPFFDTNDWKTRVEAA